PHRRCAARAAVAAALLQHCWAALFDPRFDGRGLLSAQQCAWQLPGRPTAHRPGPADAAVGARNRASRPGPPIPHRPRRAPALTDPYPWVALLLFEEGEYTLLRNIPLQQAVPPSVFTALGSPTGVTCDAVEADLPLITSIMPSYEELQLLVHVRQVNTDDRE